MLIQMLLILRFSRLFEYNMMMMIVKRKFSIFFSCLGPTTNNHDATELQEVVPDANDEGEVEGEGGDGDEDSGFKVKQRSILQAKLTKLAIQIGYAGQFVRFFFTIRKINRIDFVYFLLLRHDHRHPNCTRSINSIFNRRIHSTVNNSKSRLFCSFIASFHFHSFLEVNLGIINIGVALCDI